MLVQENKAILNKILLVIGLTILRLPRVFGLDTNVWVFFLTLAPFWFVILNNHLPVDDLFVESANRYSRVLIQLATIVIISGVQIIFAAIFVQSFLGINAHGYQIASFIILIAAIAGFVYGIVKLSDSIKMNKMIVWTGIIYFLIVIASVFRTSSQSPFLLLYIYQYVTIIFFCMSAKFVISEDDQDYFYHVYLGLIVYLIANIILNLAGFVNQTEIYLREFKAVMLSLLGLEASQIYYPLAEGINPFGYVGGVGFVMSIAYLYESLQNNLKKFKEHIVPLLSAVLCIYIILTTDSRGALLFSVMTSLLIIYFGHIRSRLIFFLCFISQLSVFSFLFNFQSDLKLLAPFIREDSDLLSGRGMIWQAGIYDLIDFEWIHLIGFGSSGQAISGIINSYNHRFQSYINTNSISLHHFALQGIYDYGYIGIAIAYLMIIAIGLKLLRKKISTTKRTSHLPILASLLFMIFAGSVSVIPAFYSNELFLLFPFIWVAAGVES